MSPRWREAAQSGHDRRAFRTLADPAAGPETHPTGCCAGEPGSSGRLAAMRTVIVNGDALTVADVVDVAFGAARAQLGPEVQARMETTRAVVAARSPAAGRFTG